MTRDEIIEIAREAGYGIQNTHLNGVTTSEIWGGFFETTKVMRFAALVEQRANAWRAAVLGALDICLMRTPENSVDPERAMSDLMAWEPRDAWRPASDPPEDRRSVEVWVTDDAGGYFAVGSYFDGSWGTTDTVTHWRDVTPPTTEGPIAAKCQRIEGSGEICGLAPPCPDCGSSLIDVPEGE